MIVCRKCSRRHPDDTEFCDCGAYLAFDGERVADAPTAATPPPGTAARPAAPDLPPPPTAAAPWQAVEPAAREAPRRPAGEPAPWGGLPGGAPGESTWGADTSDDRGPTSTVDARLPDAPTRETTAPVWVEPTSRAGDVPCSRCGSMNSPDRQFCQHCGQPLAAGLAAAVDFKAPGSRSVPWWRRLTRSARAKAARLDGSSLSMDASRLTAPGGLSSRVMMVRAGGLALVAVGLLAFLGPWKGTVVRGARTLLGGKQYEAIVNTDIRAESIAASPDIPIQPIPQEVPENVLDRHANTAWATRWLAAVPAAAAVPADPAATPTTTAVPATSTTTTAPAGACITEARTDSLLRFTFREPTDIGRVEILAGRYDADKARALFTRPRLIELTTGDRCERYELLDEGSLQALNFAADDVTQVELRIVDVYREDASSATVEISEVVFEKER
jgi:hypothetical protein